MDVPIDWRSSVVLSICRQMLDWLSVSAVYSRTCCTVSDATTQRQLKYQTRSDQPDQQICDSTTRIRPDTTRPDQTRPDQTRPDSIRPNQTRTRPDTTRPDQTKPDQTRLDQTRSDPTRPESDQTRLDQTRPDQTRSDPTRRGLRSPNSVCPSVLLSVCPSVCHMRAL